MLGPRDREDRVNDKIFDFLSKYPEAILLRYKKRKRSTEFAFPYKFGNKEFITGDLNNFNDYNNRDFRKLAEEMQDAINGWGKVTIASKVYDEMHEELPTFHLILGHIDGRMFLLGAHHWTSAGTEILTPQEFQRKLPQRTRLQKARFYITR